MVPLTLPSPQGEGGMLPRGQQGPGGCEFGGVSPGEDTWRPRLRVPAPSPKHSPFWQRDAAETRSRDGRATKPNPQVSGFHFRD